MDQRTNRNAISHPQRANPFGAIELVRGDRDQISLLRQFQLSRRLDRIAQEQCPGIMRPLRQPRDRLDRTDFIVDLHHGNQPGSFGKFHFGIDQAISADRQFLHRPAAGHCGIEQRRMLNRRAGNGPARD